MTNELTKYWVSHLCLYHSESTLLPIELPGVQVCRAADVDQVVEELQAEKAQCRTCIIDLKRQLREQEADLARVSAELEKANAILKFHEDGGGDNT